MVMPTGFQCLLLSLFRLIPRHVETDTDRPNTSTSFLNIFFFFAKRRSQHLQLIQCHLQTTVQRTAALTMQKRKKDTQGIAELRVGFKSTNDISAFQFAEFR